jgi:NADH-quinone oxidoreductase subunit D
MVLNLGPQHPATHGVLRVRLTLDGETVLHAEPVIGYLHTGFEKTAETHTYQQANTLTDRMDYLSPLTNNLAYVLAVEKLMDIEVPKRAQYIRVLFSELSRLGSHLVWLGTHVMDLGAMSVLFYCLRERELILDLIEQTAGVRMNPSYFRVGGLAYDLPEGFHENCQRFLDGFPRWMQSYKNLVQGNPLIEDRLKGVAPRKEPAEYACESGRVIVAPTDHEFAFPVTGKIIETYRPQLVAASSARLDEPMLEAAARALSASASGEWYYFAQGGVDV